MLAKPRVVTKISRDGEPPQEVKVEMTRILKPETAKKMRDMMQGVVDQPHGTGKAARLNGYTSAGKTGSAQIYDFASRKYTHRYNGSFMGFAPVNKPALVMVVTLNNTAKYGGVVAGPVFHDVMTAALRLLDVPRDRLDDTSVPPEAEPANDASDPDPDMIPVLDDEEDTLLLAQVANSKVVGPDLPPAMAALAPNGPKTPDFRGKTKRDVIAMSMETGVRVETKGLGVARRQNPPPGTVLQPGERVRVVFSR
jgi:cell division protein FtsI (penicillin-binding protein 3)